MNWTHEDCWIHEDWGLIDYSVALDKQIQVLNFISDHSPTYRGCLVYCSHFPIVTLGRKTKPAEDLLEWAGPLIEVQRGGRATYHGPSQIMVYLIYNFHLPSRQGKTHDLGWFMDTVQLSLVEVLRNEYHLVATPKSGDSQRGVWVGEKKIASMGIGVKKGISYHGMAINFNHDPLAFQGIRPCGHSAQTMTSLELETPIALSRSHFQEKLTQILLTNLA